MSAALFDIGNSRVKWGVADDAGVRELGACGHDEFLDDDFACLDDTLEAGTDAAIVCTVGGEQILASLRRKLAVGWGVELQVAESSVYCHGVRNAYADDQQLGADRWAALVGSYQMSGGSVIVVDAGTACTIDAIDTRGHHLGGMILPGVRLMISALSTNTRNIDLASMQMPAETPLLADNTLAAVYGGAVHAICGAIEHTVQAVQALGHRPEVILTGGDAALLFDSLDVQYQHQPALVLEGLAIMVGSDDA